MLQAHMVIFFLNIRLKTSLFFQEHFVCDEEPCDQGSYSVQQWNDQEMKSNLNSRQLQGVN